MDSRIGRTIIIRGFQNIMDGALIDNHGGYKMDKHVGCIFDDDTEIETLGEINLETLGTLNRLFNPESVFLESIPVKELNETELETLDILGFDFEIGTQILALKVIE